MVWILKNCILPNGQQGAIQLFPMPVSKLFGCAQISYFSSDFSSRGGTRCSLADIVVATPGRLVDHINKGSGLCLEHLRFLVSSMKLSNWIQCGSTAVIADLCHAFTLSSRSLMRLTGWLTACTSRGSVRWSRQCTGQEVDQRRRPSSGAPNRHMSQQPGESVSKCFPSELNWWPFRTEAFCSRLIFWYLKLVLKYFKDKDLVIWD